MLKCGASRLSGYQRHTKAYKTVQIVFVDTYSFILKWVSNHRLTS